MSKVSSRWVPQNLNVHNRHQRVASCQDLLDLYINDKEKFCCPLVTEDETWIHHLDAESKLKSMEWKHVDSPPPNKFRTQPPASKSYDNFWRFLRILW